MMNDSQARGINITIRSMAGNFSTMGLSLSDDVLCPKLKPMEIVEVSENHALFDSDSSRHIEVVRGDVTRPYSFENPEDMADYLAKDKSHKQRMLMATAQIGTSQEQSARIRAENKVRRDEMLANGTLKPEPVAPAMPDLHRQDTVEGLGAPSDSNAFKRVAPADEVIAPLGQQNPPSRSRRGNRRGG